MNSRLNVKPGVWGATTWAMLHTFAEAMPDTLNMHEQAEVTKFFQSLTTVLPCHKCRTHLQELYDIGYFPPVDTKDNIKSALFRLHNKVSGDLGKPMLDKLPDLTDIIGMTFKNSTHQVNDIEEKIIFSRIIYIIVAIFVIIALYILFRRNVFYTKS